MMTPDELLATVKHHATADIDPFALWAGLRSARDDITRLAWVIETQRQEIAALRTEIIGLKRSVAHPPLHRYWP
jgi:hypothetical protein